MKLGRIQLFKVMINSRKMLFLMPPLPPELLINQDLLCQVTEVRKFCLILEGLELVLS